MLGMDIEEVRQEVQRAASRSRHRAAAAARTGPEAEPEPERPVLPEPHDLTTERETSKLLIQTPQLFEPAWDGLTVGDFTHPAYAAVFTSVDKAGTEDARATWVHRVSSAADNDQVRSLVAALAVEPVALTGAVDARYVVANSAKLQLLTALRAVRPAEVEVAAHQPGRQCHPSTTRCSPSWWCSRHGLGSCRPASSAPRTDARAGCPQILRTPFPAGWLCRHRGVMESWGDGELDRSLLTAEEEVSLALRIEAGVLAASALEQDYPPPGATAAELTQLAAEGEMARRRFTEANLGLVGMVARQFATRSGVNQADVFQEACLGLLVAVTRFDFRRGFRFATYALYWIRAYAGAATARMLGDLNLPTSRATQLRALRGMEAALEQSLGRAASARDIAAAVGRSEAWVADVLAHAVPTSLTELESDERIWAPARLEAEPDLSASESAGRAHRTGTRGPGTPPGLRHRRAAELCRGGRPAPARRQPRSADRADGPGALARRVSVRRRPGTVTTPREDSSPITPLALEYAAAAPG